MIVPVITSDKVIWNQQQVYSDIVFAISNNDELCIDFKQEGPDLFYTDIESYIFDQCNRYNYNPAQVKIKTSNLLQSHNVFQIEKIVPLHLVNNARQINNQVVKNIKQHFGIFVNRSNAPRLDLASHIFEYYSNKSTITYHYNSQSTYHKDNIGVEELIKDFDCENISIAAVFLQNCPIVPHKNFLEPTNQSKLNPAQQLLHRDRDVFLSIYNNFFVEIVCETYYTGNTFFPTEKIWRPIMMNTPFIVQGPALFLENLKKLGFKTFDRWWDEGYSEDPVNWQPIEIKKILKKIASKSTHQLQQMYNEMLPILNHNRELLLTLNEEHFKAFTNE